LAATAGEVLTDDAAGLRDLTAAHCPPPAGPGASAPGLEGDLVMAQPSPDTSSMSPVPPGTYRLDPDRSTVRVAVKTFVGLLTVHGTFRLQSGQVTIAADPLASRAQAVIATKSFNSGNILRDHDVISGELLDAAAYPTITFTSSRIQQAGADWVVSGSVTARGTTSDAEMRVREVRMEGSAVRFRATTTVDRTRFGLTKRKGLVGQFVDIEIKAVAVPV
jgi:polyisoprenoid-binding protein YceI